MQGGVPAREAAINGWERAAVAGEAKPGEEPRCSARHQHHKPRDFGGNRQKRNAPRQRGAPCLHFGAVGARSGAEAQDAELALMLPHKRHCLHDVLVACGRTRQRQQGRHSGGRRDARKRLRRDLGRPGSWRGTRPAAGSPPVARWHSSTTRHTTRSYGQMPAWEGQ